MPVIYISDIIKNPEKLKIAVESIIFISKLITKYSHTTAHTDSYNDALQVIKCSFYSLNENSKRIYMLKDIIMSIETENNKSIQTIKDFFNKYPNIVTSYQESTNNTTTLENIKEFIQCYKTKHNKLPSKADIRSEMPDSELILKKIGSFKKFAMTI